MKRKLSIRIIAVSAIMLITLSGILSGCGSSTASNEGNSNSTAAANTDTSKSSSISGSITIAGSTALQPLVKEAADKFMAKNPGAQVQVQGGGSGTGLTQVLQGSIDIGNSDIFAEEKLPADKAKALVDYKVGVVGFVTVANPKVTVENLTQQQLIDVFTGKVKNWKELGGNDMPIVVVNRPASSGTRFTFKKYALKGNEEVAGKALTEDASGTVRQAVAQTDGAISYLALSYLDNTIKSLKFEGVDATVDNITSGKYPIWSYEHMYTKGNASGLAKAFLDYMTSDEVQKTLVTNLKYIPVADMKVSR